MSGGGKHASPAWVTDLASYPFTFEVQARFADLDLMGHINNVALVGIFQEGRYHFFNRVGAGDKDHWQRIVLRRQAVDYLREGMSDDPITLGIGVTEIGRSSVQIMHAAFQAGQCIAVNETVSVATGEGGSAPLLDAVRERFEGWRVNATQEA